MPTALITGISGQDGTYLAEWLAGRSYRVVGTTRRLLAARSGPFSGALSQADLVESALGTVDEARRVLRAVQPDEIYHLAGPSGVAASWDDPVATVTDVGRGAAILLDAVWREVPAARIVLAGSAEMFAPATQPLAESAPRVPLSPYGAAKLLAAELVRVQREGRGQWAATAILFNHESPRRGTDFVTGKIAAAVARIARGAARELRLGALDARRDWGFAGDYMRAMWLMARQEEPVDLVIGTGVAHTVAEFCAAAFGRVGLPWEEHVVSDPELFRVGDAPLRLASPGEARRRLGWSPEVDFHGLVSMMVDHEISVAGREMGHPSTGDPS